MPRERTASSSSRMALITPGPRGSHHQEDQHRHDDHEDPADGDDPHVVLAERDRADAHRGGVRVEAVEVVGEAVDAVRAAEDRIETHRAECEPQDFGGRDGDDGQVVRAQPKCRSTEQQRKHNSGRDAHEQTDPEAPAHHRDRDPRP